MSGGSYDYLAVRFPDTIPNDNKNLERMLDRLFSEYPGAKATRDTFLVSLLLNKAYELSNKLFDVWHAVEWEDSGDTSKEDTKEAIAKYEEEV